MFEFALPDVGEGLTEAEVVTWHVVVGDSVQINDTLVDIETAKSVVELPSPAAGVITAVHVEEGSTVDVGTIIVTIDDGVAAKQPEPIPAPGAAEPPNAVDEEPLVLVGKAPTAAVPRTRKLRGRPAATQGTALGVALEERTSVAGKVRTKPPVRLLAKRLGVDLSTVLPSVGDIITRSDVESAAGAVGSTTFEAVQIPRFSRDPRTD
ncbi:biotin/lipoyl-containing protein [Aeromicrobium sp. UC242_57]|uniref:biotin/lipoyl-containing protein n=1 Tax=Aeromicrobium sp. UC242_57 TaxID=3374624 RepID=UPI0037B51687